jgi:hypothetical protein
METIWNVQRWAGMNGNMQLAAALMQQGAGTWSYQRLAGNVECPSYGSRLLVVAILAITPAAHHSSSG